MFKLKCFSSDFENLQKRIKRITKKLDKHNINYSYQVGNTAIEEVPVYDYRNLDNIPSWQFHPKYLGKRAVEVQYYNFEMDELKLGNFEVLAVLDHVELENGNLIHVLKEGFEVPEKYRTIKSICEHCNNNRQRNKTVLLLDTITQEIKQVGTTCLKEYTGIEAMDILNIYTDIHDVMLENCNEVSELEEDFVRGINMKYINTVDYLTNCIHIIENFGYEKGENGEPTKIRGFQKTIKVIDSDKDKAEKVVEYFSQNQFKNDFLNNIKLYLENEYVKCNGLIAYAYLAYKKEMEKQKPIITNNTSYYGKVGDKVQLELTMDKRFCFESEYGIIKIYIFRNENNNVFKWQSSNSIDFEEGKRVNMKGIIKEHIEYNGTKQTVLTRCKVV